jgi:hypothetical protein
MQPGFSISGGRKVQRSLDACARILLKGGAASVTGAVLAREELLQNPN